MPWLFVYLSVAARVNGMLFIPVQAVNKGHAIRANDRVDNGIAAASPVAQQRPLWCAGDRGQGKSEGLGSAHFSRLQSWFS